MNAYLSAAWAQNSPCPGCVELNFQRFGQRPETPPSDDPFTYPVPASQSDWNSYNSTVVSGKPVGQTDVQESDVLRIEVRKNYGGSVQIYDKVTRQNLINFFDLGRESGMSSYTGPDSFSDDAPYWRTGYNPLQAGDSGGNPAKLLFHGSVNGYIYTKYQCNSWAHIDNRLLEFYYEQWVKLSGNKVIVKVRLTHQRGDKTFYRAYSQEWPFMMINGARIVHFYNGSSPFTMASTTKSDGIERRLNDGTYILHQLTPFQVTEPWMATEIGSNTNGETRLIGITGPNFHHVGYNVSDIISGSNSEDGRTITYTGHHPMIHIDSDNTWLKEYTYVVGNESEIRQYAYSQARTDKPDFAFTKSHGRNGWFIQDGGHDQKEPFQVDNWTVTYDGKADPGQPLSARGTKLISPWGSWKSSDFNTIYIRMRYSGPETQLRVTWLIDGQAADGVDANYPNQNAIRFPRGVRNQIQQSLPFTVINDGQMHTYKLSFSGNQYWQGVIQQFEITHNLEGPVIPPGEVVEMVYFGVNNPDNQ
ncbi:hypothetical protein WBJ53_20985 [Spirosoma sp. SC4-14]|uniref:hypothetical protein n=1 Tax=Spirosoma sp. SC4-14 TaxID=3128900 RepID=UPI0030D3BCC5